MELKTYTSQPIDIVGEVHVSVCYGDQHEDKLLLIIVKGNGPTF